MRNKISLTVAFLLGLGGCSSLHNTILSKVHEGDTQDQVTAALGAPDSFGPSQSIPGATKWVYGKRSDTCAIVFEGDKVVKTACGKNLNYVNPVSAALKGFSDGYNAGRQRSISCNTVASGGGNSQTTCN